MTPQTSLIADAIRAFDFPGYGLDGTDPTDSAAEWVTDLAAAIHTALLTRTETARSLTVAHPVPGRCHYCDERHERIVAAVQRALLR